eukprot:scaffold1546_cov121-Skeletonema_marinoi.AAC.11
MQPLIENDSMMDTTRALREAKPKFHHIAERIGWGWCVAIAEPRVRTGGDINLTTLTLKESRCSWKRQQASA